MTHARRPEKMKLGAFFHPTGNHVASWLHPDAQIDAGSNFQHYVELATTAERGMFDLMFLADAVATRDGNLQALSRWPQYMAFLDPLTLLAGVAALTRHIGLVATSTTSYNEPYTLARRYASLDIMSGGRAGWNVVTSANTSEAYNFGRTEHYAHAERYERAREFVDVVKGLWDSWDDDAFIRDRATQTYFAPGKIALPEAQRQALFGAGTAERSTTDTGLSSHRPGERLGCWHGPRRSGSRDHVFAPA